MKAEKEEIEQRPSLLGDFAAFLRAHRLWWIAPLVVVAMLFVVLIFLSGTATTPFIYQAH